MGIKHLNQYLLKNCSNRAISKISLEHLKGKTIVVDISIYIYKFLIDGQYMEHLYFFLGLFKYYQIEPIFIFDGKPPPEKWDIIKKRKCEKNVAKLEYDALLDQIDELSTDMNENIEEKLSTLKKRMISMKDADISETKKMIDLFGFTYYDAIGEADEVCAYFVLNGLAWACLTDDMDMFLYGCPKVIRSLSMMKREIVLYDTEKIMSELSMPILDFIKVVLLTGSDYYSENTISIKLVFEHYYNYKRNNIEMDFYKWLSEHKNISIDESFHKIYEMFTCIKEKEELHMYDNLHMKQEKKIFKMSQIKEMLLVYGFIFI
jgi:hypothetical protein